MHKSFEQRISIAAKVAAILGGIALSGHAPAARAQSASDEISEVVVTGSRILRKDSSNGQASTSSPT